jgi:hypothetical protein
VNLEDVRNEFYEPYVGGNEDKEKRRKTKENWATTLPQARGEIGIILGAVLLCRCLPVLAVLGAISPFVPIDADKTVRLDFFIKFFTLNKVTVKRSHCRTLLKYLELMLNPRHINQMASSTTAGASSHSRASLLIRLRKFGHSQAGLKADPTATPDHDIPMTQLRCAPRYLPFIRRY